MEPFWTRERLILSTIPKKVLSPFSLVGERLAPLPDQPFGTELVNIADAGAGAAALPHSD